MHCTSILLPAILPTGKIRRDFAEPLIFSGEGASAQLSRGPFTVTHLRRRSREGGVEAAAGGRKDTVSSPLSVAVVIWPNFSVGGPDFHPD